MNQERVYLADKTVIGCNGAKHVYFRKANDESHKTLMLGICGNGEVIKPLIILEKSLPFVGEGESNHIPQKTLLCKSNKGSVEKDVFCQWLENSVTPHKQLVNPNDFSLLLLDNHGSRFSVDAIEICTENKIEMLYYPGHLTHILQGPDVVLNKPISSIVDQIIHKKSIISGKWYHP